MLVESVIYCYADMFFEVLFKPENYPTILLYRSEVSKENPPKWNSFQLSTTAVGGLDLPFTVKCLQWDKEGVHKIIGESRTTLREFTLPNTQLPLLSPLDAAEYANGALKGYNFILVIIMLTLL